MSKGPGRIERALAAIFDSEPDNAFTTEDLCERIYSGCQIEKKHRVAVMRAAAQLARRRDTLITWRSGSLGGPNVYFNEESVMSYAMARLKADSWYRSKDPRNSRLGNIKTEENLIAEFSKGWHREDVVPGGAWWRHVQQFKELREAIRSGDLDKAEQLRSQHSAENMAAALAILAGEPF